MDDPIWSSSKNRTQATEGFSQAAKFRFFGSRLALQRRQRPGLSGLDLKSAVGRGPMGMSVQGDRGWGNGIWNLRQCKRSLGLSRRQASSLSVTMANLIKVLLLEGGKGPERRAIRSCAS